MSYMSGKLSNEEKLRLKIKRAENAAYHKMMEKNMLEHGFIPFQERQRTPFAHIEFTQTHLEHMWALPKMQKKYPKKKDKGTWAENTKKMLFNGPVMKSRVIKEEAAILDVVAPLSDDSPELEGGAPLDTPLVPPPATE